MRDASSSSDDDRARRIAAAAVVARAGGTRATAPSPPPTNGDGRRRFGTPVAFVAMLASMHVLINVSLSTRRSSASPSSPFAHPSRDDEEGSSSHPSSLRRRRRRRRRRMTSGMKNDDDDDHDNDEAYDIVRRSYASTFGALASRKSIERSCDASASFALCVKSMLDEVKSLSSSSSSSTTEGVGLAEGASTSSMSFPWWFVTMLRDAPVRATWHNLTMIRPPMDFCTIEKIATTQWRNVQCVLNEGKIISKNPMPCQLNKTRLEARRADVAGETRGGGGGAAGSGGGGAYRAVMLRDPLERFLSGYLNKCVSVPTRKFEGHCEPNVIFNATAMTGGIRDDPGQLFGAYVDAFPLRWNIHFFPQSLYCDGLYRHVMGYDYVGYMGEDFYGELDRMISTFEGAPGGDLFSDTINRVFRPSSKSSSSSKGGGGGGGHSTLPPSIPGTSPPPMHVGGGGRKRGYDVARHATNAPEYVKEYYTASSVRRALEYFAIDYLLLDLEIPLWVHNMLADDVDAFGGMEETISPLL